MIKNTFFQVIVGQFAESDADKDMAQKLLDILYATEDGFAIPEDENGMPAPPEEFWAFKWSVI